MKTIEPQFRHNQFDYRQLTRIGDVAIYEQTKGKIRAFEVVRIGRHNGFSVAGKTFPPSETYPSSEQWGQKGWTYTDLESARAKLQSLVESRA